MHLITMLYSILRNFAPVLKRHLTRRMRKISNFLIISFFALTCVQTAMAQKFALKTNLLETSVGTFNLGGEVRIATKWTFELDGKYNPWTFSDNKKWKYWQVQPNLRYWFCEKMNGHFIGFHLFGGEYNMGNLDMNLGLFGSDFKNVKDYRLEGFYVGSGLDYGYAWMLGRHWNMEAELGLGYIFTQYDKYRCPKCGEKLETNKNHNYVGPTKVALNLIYVF